MRHASPGTRGHYAALALIFLISVWLRDAFPILAIGNAAHDDQLFIKLAKQIGDGNWLGPYNNLTHAKGVTYPVFLSANYVIGLPVKLSEHVFYLSAALFFSSTVGMVCAARWATLITFALLAFIPTAWNPHVGGRIIREGFYASLSLFLLGLAFRCFVVHRAASVAEELRDKWLCQLLLGLVAGAYLLTREEGVWLLPSVTIIYAYWVCSRWLILRPWKLTVLFVLLPLLPALLVIGMVNSLNYFKYGVFRNNDLRSSEFLAAYGSLSRLRHDQWQRYVVFPKDARERAYRFSAAARELHPSFEGVIGNFWRNVGCAFTGFTPCPEILSGWFIWALRDATAAAGHYRSAEEARSFYLRLAAEIDSACDEHPGECLSHRETLVPPWRGHYFVDTLRRSADVFSTLVSMGGAPVAVGASVGSPQELAMFAVVTNGPLAPAEQSAAGTKKTDSNLAPARDTIRYATARRLAKAAGTISELGVPAAIAVWVAWGLIAVRRRELDAVLVMASVLVAAVATRVILLAFLDVTSFRSNNIRYLQPVAPMALALISTVLFGIVGWVGKTGLRRNQSSEPSRGDVDV